MFYQTTLRCCWFYKQNIGNLHIFISINVGCTSKHGDMWRWMVAITICGPMKSPLRTNKSQFCAKPKPLDCLTGRVWRWQATQSPHDTLIIHYFPNNMLDWSIYWKPVGNRLRHNFPRACLIKLTCSIIVHTGLAITGNLRLLLWRSPSWQVAWAHVFFRNMEDLTRILAVQTANLLSQTIISNMFQLVFWNWRS